MVSNVQDWLDNPSQNFGWAVLTDEVNVSAKRFDSRENPDAANQPRLVVTYTASASNTAPAASNDSFSTSEGSTLNVPTAHGVAVEQIVEPPALAQGLEHQGDVALLEVADAAVYELGAAARRALGEVAPFQEQRPIPPGRRLDGAAQAGGPASDDEHVPGLVSQTAQIFRSRSCALRCHFDLAF